jgi:hypothetical protein
LSTSWWIVQSVFEFCCPRLHVIPFPWPKNSHRVTSSRWISVRSAVTTSINVTTDDTGYYKRQQWTHVVHEQFVTVPEATLLPFSQGCLYRAFWLIFGTAAVTCRSTPFVVNKILMRRDGDFVKVFLGLSHVCCPFLVDASFHVELSSRAGSQHQYKSGLRSYRPPQHSSTPAGAWSWIGRGGVVGVPGQFAAGKFLWYNPCGWSEIFSFVIFLRSYRQPGLLCTPRNFARSSKFLRKQYFLLLRLPLRHF